MYGLLSVTLCMILSLHFLCHFPAPSSPRSLRITASTETSVMLSWMPPDPPNGPLSIYRISYKEEDVPTTVSTILITSTTITLSSLQADVVYVVSVRGSTISEVSSLNFGSAAMLRIMNGMWYAVY